MGKSFEQLFLLEVLVERITLRRSILEKYYTTQEDASVPLCVKVKFIDFPYFEINQEDFRQQECLDAATVGDFSSGKSCLFPMEPVELVRAIQQSPLHIILLRKTPGICPPDILGSTDVFLSSDMCKTIRKAMDSQKELPISSTLQDSYNLRNSYDEDAGFITLFVRLSCFGQSIVTQFKLVNETKSFLFKNSKEDSEFKCENCVCTPPPIENLSSRTSPLKQKRVSYDEGIQSSQSPCVSAENGPESTISALPDVPQTLPCGCLAEKKPDLSSCECPPDSDKNPPPDSTGWCDAEECDNRGVSRDFAERRVSKQLQDISGSDQSKSPACILCEHCRQIKSQSDITCDQSQKSKAPPSISCDRCCQSPSPPNIPNDYFQQTKSPPCIPCDVCGQPKSPPCNHNQQLKSPPCIPCDDCHQPKPPPCASKPPPKSLYPCNKCHPKLQCGEGSPPRSSPCARCESPRTARQPLISCDECEAPSRPLAPECPGEQEIQCKCDELSGDDPRDDCPTRCYEYSDYSRDCCNTSCCCPAPRPPFSERDEDDIVPVMPVYCSQENIYDPDFDQRKCPEEVRKSSEQWKMMMTCECHSDNRNVPTDQAQEQDYVFPPVRYDTTGALSSVYGGVFVTGKIVVHHPAPRYDATGALSAAFNNPPVRYDTTSALSPAYQGGAPGLEFLSQDPTCGGPRGSESTPGIMQNLPTDPAFINTMEQTSLSDAMIFGDGANARRKRKQRKCWRPPPKSRRRFVYSWGGNYPGVKVGHRNCLQMLSDVPAKMGWLWYPPDTSDGLKPRPAWRPGAVSRSVARVIREVQRAAGYDEKSIASKKKSDKSLAEQISLEKPQLPPTLHIHRRDGAYYISMHPMNLVPEENNVPLQFRIPAQKKNDDDSDSCGCEDAESNSSSELEIEFMAPGVYWPGQNEQKTEDKTQNNPDPNLQYIMNVGGQGDSTTSNAKRNGNGKGKGKGKGKAGGKGKGKVTLDSEQGQSPPSTVPDPEKAPKSNVWDKDDQPTAVGKKR